MIVNRISVFVVCLGLVICLGGCMNRGERLTYALKSDQEQADEIMENIMNALEEKDSDALLDQFSTKTQKDQEDLEQQIEGLIQYYHGEKKEFSGDVATEEHNNRGKLIEKSFWGNYTVITDEMTYYVSYKFQSADEDKDKVGLSALEFVTEEPYQKAVDEQGYYQWQFSEKGDGVYWAD